jgi:hypothetical protein
MFPVSLRRFSSGKDRRGSGLLTFFNPLFDLGWQPGNEDQGEKALYLSGGWL